MKSILIISFQDVENEKALVSANAGNTIQGSNKSGSEQEKNLETAEYQAIANIYKAISEYREELRKLQEFQREEIG